MYDYIFLTRYSLENKLNKYYIIYMNIAYLNFYMSALRNMFLTSSIAMGMIGFSDRFKANNKLLVLIVATFVIVLSISFGLHATNNFIVMLKKASNEKSMSSLDAELLGTIKTMAIICLFLFWIFNFNFTCFYN